MKIRTIVATATLAFTCAVAPLSAQDVHTVFGDRVANTPQDLLRVLPVSPYTWDAGDAKAQIKFNADGTGKHSFFEFTWTVQDAQHVEIMTNDTNKKIVLTFDTNYASYSGLDFDGHQLSGRIVAPPKPAATPKPIAARPTPTPLVAASTSAPTPPPVPVTGGPAIATPTPVQASGDFFKNLQTGGGNYSSTTASGGELVAALAGKEYSGFLYRGGTVKFNADGTCSSNFSGYKKMTWKVRSAHEIEIYANGRDAERKIIMRFSGDMSKYTGTENYGDYDYEFKGAINN